MGNCKSNLRKSHHNTIWIQTFGTKYFLLKILKFLSKNPFQATWLLLAASLALLPTVSPKPNRNLQPFFHSTLSLSKLLKMNCVPHHNYCLSFAHFPCSNPSICTLVIIHHKPPHPASMWCFRQPRFPTIPALLNAHSEINFEEYTIVYLFCFSQTRVQVKLNGQPTSETGCKSILKTTALK